MSPNVAIIGRPNVGKSTLFNRLIGYSKAIVADQPGVTRDRIYAEVVLDLTQSRQRFSLIDTGGIGNAVGASIAEQVAFQSKVAIHESDLILAIFDAGDGLLPDDQAVIDLLRKAQKPFLVVINKVDNEKRRLLASEFYRLGVDQLIMVSAAHGLGMDDLRHALCSQLNQIQPAIEGEPQAEEDPLLRVAIAGRPNVGKSSLINALLNDNRLLVSEIPGTTRDAIDIELTAGNRRLLLIDTAGLRRKSKIDDDLEKHTVSHSLRSIDRAHVVAIVLTATEFMTDQDLRIANYALEQKRGLFFIINKWDLLPPSAASEKEYQKTLFRFAKTLDFMPLVFTSAKTHLGIEEIVDMAFRISESRKFRVTTSVLNQFIHSIVETTPPPSSGHKMLSIKYATQTGVSPPIFTLFAKGGVHLPSSYKRYLIAQIRKKCGFAGVPVTISMADDGST
jgi:GTP-binding protein